MQKRSIPVVLFALFFLLVVGTFFTYYGGCVWAEDYYGLTIDFNGAETSKDIKVLIEIFEYTPGMITLGPSIMAPVVINTKSSLNIPSGAITIPLPKGKKFLLRAEPLAGRTSSTGSYQFKEANYQSQFYSRKRTFQEAVTSQSFIDTSGSATTGTRIIALEQGFKIEGSIKPCGSSSTYIEGVTVKVYDENRVPVTRYGKSTGGTNGVNYTIYGLSPGKYYLLADGPSKGYMRKFYKGSTGTDKIDDAELVEIKNSDVTGKNICLDQGYAVKGTLFAPDGSLMKHRTSILLQDVVYSIPLGVYLYDPNAPYDDLTTRLYYHVYGGMLDLSYSKNDPHFSIGGLDPNYSIGGSPKGALGQCILIAGDSRGAYAEYAPNVYNGHYFVGDADPISIKSITPSSTFDLNFKQAGTIAGTVKDKTGTPLGSIVVKAIDANNESNVIQPTYTDPNGRYKFVGLPPMDYKVQVTDDVSHKYLWQYYQNKFSFIQANKIQLTEQNLNASHIDFEMEIGGRIAGTVQEASTHAAIAGMTIQAFMIGSGSNLENYPIATTVSGGGITDESGKYEISGLPIGRYVIYARPSLGDNHTAVFYQDSDTLNGADSNLIIDHTGQLIDFCNFLLKKGGIIQGKITGIPPEIKVYLIGNIHVDLMEAKTGKLMQSTTENIDPNTFSYTIMGIPKGEYKIAVTDLRMPPEMLKKYYNKENTSKGVFTYKEASTLEIDPAAASMQIDFTWDSVGERISGKVMADNPEQSPLLNIKIEAYLVDGTSGKLLNTGIYDRTKPTGMYCIKGLVGGIYVLKAVDDMSQIYPIEFYDPGYNTFTPDKAVRITLPLSNANVSYDFKLNSQIGIIDGVVTKGTAKSLFPGALVYLYGVESDQLLQNAITDPNGRYRFTGLPEGGYKIMAFDPERAYVPRFYTSNGSMYAFNNAEGESVTVKYADPPSSTHKNILLDKQGVQIEGTVKNSTGSVLPDIFIYLYQKNGDKWSFVTNYTVATDSNGKYTIKALLPGTYRVLAWEYGNNYTPKNQDVILDQQGKSGVDFTLSEVDTGSQTQKYTVDMSAGLNLFCFPTRVPLWPSSYNAGSLLSEWTAADDPGIISILRLNTEKGKWESQLSNFIIENGNGYIVYSQTNKKITYSGELFPGQDSFAIDLQKGMSIVGNIKGTAGYDSYTMLKKLPSNKIYGIRSYDPDRGKWLNSTLFWGKSGGDRFPVYPTKAYIVDMKEPHLSWLP